MALLQWRQHQGTCPRVGGLQTTLLKWCQQMSRKFSRTNSHKNYVTFCLAIPWTSQARPAVIGCQDDEQLPWSWRHDHGKRPIQAFFWNPLHLVQYLRRIRSVWFPVKSKILYVHKGNAQLKKLKSPNHFFKDSKWPHFFASVPLMVYGIKRSLSNSYICINHIFLCFRYITHLLTQKM